MATKVKRILNGVTLGTGAGTDVHATKIDFQSLGVTREFLLAAKTVTDASVAPGAADTFTVNMYWSNEDLTFSATVATQLAARKIASAAKTLTNTAGITQYWDFGVDATQIATGGLPIRPRARYLYITVDNTAVAAAVTLTLDLMKVRSQASKID